ncbi:hypothetical protein B296_00051490 [Ensete ventricosum]|uniref:Uncharacterized protein n=1 Tax=Ensete ventricosum TaxID=4639 RepID=A0A426X8H8_ENSVE|nr:hypothetical protein B296_00051490 [Ensete ventricosum]
MSERVAVDDPWVSAVSQRSCPQTNDDRSYCLTANKKKKGEALFFLEAMSASHPWLRSTLCLFMQSPQQAPSSLKAVCLISTILATGMTDVNLAVTSPRSRTVGLLTWPTRRAGAGLTQTWKGQPSYGRPSKGKGGKVDIPQLQGHVLPQGPRTAW